MNERLRQIVGQACAVATVSAIMVVPAMAPAGPPALSTNPGKHVIFPAKGQTPEQQKQDELAAYDWATQQTGWDPYQAAEKTAAQGELASDKSDSAKGGAVKGAAGGAILGVAIGAIAGDAGTGAAIGAVAGGLTGGVRSHRTRREAKSAGDAAASAYAEQFALWDRNFVAAMEGKGYTVR
jgi:hypothetical protein